MTSAGRAGATTVIVRCVHGLEWACAAEVAALTGGEQGIRLGRREVSFDVSALGAGLLGLRTADDAFACVGQVSGVGTGKDTLPVLGRAVAGLDWRAALDRLRGVRELPERVAFDIVVSLEGRRRYSRFDAEASVGEALVPVLAGEYLKRDAGGRIGAARQPDLTVRIFVRDERAVVAVRIGSRPLHRRAYKAETGPGTLHPPVAAVLAAIAAPQAGLLVDPFCGDGTIAIEAALARPGLRVLASDIDPERAGHARRNAERAGVRVEVSRADAAGLGIGARGVAVVTNPPWSQAVGLHGRPAASGPELWDLLSGLTGDSGVLCCLTDASLGLPDLAAGDGWSVPLRQQIRLAGRVAHLLLAGPPGAAAPAVTASLASWRERAIAAGIVTESGF